MKRRLNSHLNASGMADIAFLLLIFFLVATTFLKDKGVKATLPQYYEGPPGKMADNQVLNIKINLKDEILLEGNRISIDDLIDEVKQFILAEGNEQNFSSKAVISLQHDLRTSYKAYLSVYAKIKTAYGEMRNELSKELFKLEYKDLSIKDRNVIIAQLPIKLSEAEPFMASN